MIPTFRLGQLGSRVVAAAAAPGAGLPPNGIGAGANLTFWYDGDGSAHYIGAASTSGSASSDGDNVNRADSENSIVRCIQGSVATREIPVAVGGNGFYISGVAQPNQFGFFTRPSAGVNPSVASTVGTLFTAANGVIIMAAKVDDAGPDTGNPYSNSFLVAEPAGYFGLSGYKSGGNFVYQAHNYTGGIDTNVLETVPLGTWTVITMKHSGGQLRIRRNGGAWTSVASGNTDVTSGAMSAFDEIEASCAQFATYNAAITDANILEVERWMGLKIGVTI